MTSYGEGFLPDSNDSSLCLRRPTAEECIKLWTITASSWADALPPQIYLQEQAHLTTVPLAKDGGMTTWVLVDASLHPNQQQILSSCETYRKRSLLSDANGKVKEGIVHGVASVFCTVECRGRGYAARMMKELAKKLFTWQTENHPCIGSILYSDIGKTYYAQFGWRPNATNSHIELKPSATPWPGSAKPISTSDLEDLCKKDEELLRKAMRTPSADIPSRMAIIPDLAHMQWHHAKEDYSCAYLFNIHPTVKGAIAGPPGNRIWAIWTHRYYDRLEAAQPNNVLYILRFVIETDPTATRLPSDAQKRPTQLCYDEIVRGLRAVLQAAQAEAALWSLDSVQLWDPTPLARDALARSGLEYDVAEREKGNIASLLWYDDYGGFGGKSPLWVNCEHYAWM